METEDEERQRLERRMREIVRQQLNPADAECVAQFIIRGTPAVERLLSPARIAECEQIGARMREFWQADARARKAQRIAKTAHEAYYSAGKKSSLLSHRG